MTGISPSILIVVQIYTFPGLSLRVLSQELSDPSPGIHMSYNSGRNPFVHNVCDLPIKRCPSAQERGLQSMNNPSTRLSQFWL